ncbi:unnamed protein product [Ilex paraguariensis]|uniref:Uncharacterized protein n=1 Tax=Ilex paraguariensis TaxID=185542 RepID=A0ABC8SQR1_9AQUA
MIELHTVKSCEFLGLVSWPLEEWIYGMWTLNLDSVEVRIEGVSAEASSTILANLAIDNLDNLADLEIFRKPVDYLRQTPGSVS